MTHMLSEPGFWEIDAEEYHSDPAPKPSLSQSIGKVLLERCPRSAWYAHPRLNPAFKPEDSTKFDRGTVAHQLLIGKGRDFHIIDAPDYRTKAAQMERDMARAAGKTPRPQPREAFAPESAPAFSWNSRSSKGTGPKPPRAPNALAAPA